MGVTVKEIVDQIESLADVNAVESYSADHDFCSPDVIHVHGDAEEEVEEIIEPALGDNESYLKVADDAYMFYRPLGDVVEDNGSQFEILGLSERSFEAVLTEPASHETEPVGSVLRFDVDDTDIKVSMNDHVERAA